MDNASRYYCSKCYSMYDELTHKPRILQKCLHSFCEQCLSKMIDNFSLICPEDQMVVERVRSVEDFPLNYELLRYIRQNKNTKVFMNLHSSQANSNQQNDINEVDNSTQSVSSSHLINTTIRFNGEDRSINLGSNLVCPIHRYKFEYYCQDHKLPLCLTCVQGKEHQNHTIIDNYELKYRVLQQGSKKILDSKQRIESVHNTLKDQHLYYENEQKSYLNDVHQILQNRQREVTLLIEQKYQVCNKFLEQDLVHKLRNLEDLAVRQVGILVLKMEDYVRETLSFSQKDICFQITEFHRRLDQMMIEPQIQLTEQEDSIIRQGQSIMQKIQNFLNTEKHQISSIISDNIRVSFKDLNLDNYCQIPQSLQLIPETTLMKQLVEEQSQPQSPQPQQQLPQSRQQLRFSPEPHSQLQLKPKTKPYSQICQVSQTQSQPRSKPKSQQYFQPQQLTQPKSPSAKKQRQSVDTSYLSYSKNSYSRQPHNNDNDHIIKTDGNCDKPIPQFLMIAPQTEKKKASIKQQHFFSSNPRGKSNDSRIIDGIKQLLKGDKELDKLDMSNQDLHDSDINQICEWLLTSKSNIEIIKLAKNKITDQGFSILLRCLQRRPNIHTLNLTSNLCSEKALILLDQYLKKGKFHIKIIYLTNCKIINPVRYKDVQLELQNLGINLYL